MRGHLASPAWEGGLGIRTKPLTPPWNRETQTEHRHSCLAQPSTSAGTGHLTASPPAPRILGLADLGPGLQNARFPLSAWPLPLAPWDPGRVEPLPRNPRTLAT